MKSDFLLKWIETSYLLAVYILKKTCSCLLWVTIKACCKLRVLKLTLIKWKTWIFFIFMYIYICIYIQFLVLLNIYCTVLWRRWSLSSAVMETINTDREQRIQGKICRSRSTNIQQKLRCVIFKHYMWGMRCRSPGRVLQLANILCRQVIFTKCTNKSATQSIHCLVSKRSYERSERLNGLVCEASDVNWWEGQVVAAFTIAIESRSLWRSQPSTFNSPNKHKGSEVMH